MVEDYIRPKTLGSALELIKQANGRERVMAGGTDLLLKQYADHSDNLLIVDITNIPDLTGISSTGEYIRIGSTTILADIVNSPLLTGSLQVLCQGASAVGSPQIRNRATIGGNLCNASPSADTVPPLLALDAMVILVSMRKSRQVRLKDFFIGPGLTILDPDELMTEILIPLPKVNQQAVYLKHAPRSAMDLAIASTAVCVWKAGGRIIAKIALGAVAPIPMRAYQAEVMLASASLPGDETLQAVAKCAAGETSPIDDVRASARYRKAMIEVLTFRALRQTISGL